MNDVLMVLRIELERESDEQVRNSGRRFFKEEVKLYGVKTAVVTKIADRYFREMKDLDKEYILNLCEDLFSTGYMEDSFIAARWSYKLQSRAVPEDFALYERWVDSYITNWASCDTFCNHTIGTFLEKYPDYLDHLRTWTRSDKRFVRRAAAVSLIVPARRGKFLDDALTIADLLLTDRDDLVQKGYGWLLKEESRVHQLEILEFVLARKDRMPRTALRYAIELMPPELKKLAMAK